MITINEINSYISEAITIPWRSGIVPVKCVEFKVDKDKYFGLLINNLNTQGNIPPFVVVTQNEDFFKNSNPGDKTFHGYLIPPFIVKQKLKNKIKTTGEGKATLLFQAFSSKQDFPGLVGFLSKFFDREIRIINIEGIKSLQGKSFSIVAKKSEYSIPTKSGTIKSGIVFPKEVNVKNALAVEPFYAIPVTIWNITGEEE